MFQACIASYSAARCAASGNDTFAARKVWTFELQSCELPAHWSYLYAARGCTAAVRTIAVTTILRRRERVLMRRVGSFPSMGEAQRGRTADPEACAGTSSVRADATIRP